MKKFLLSLLAVSAGYFASANAQQPPIMGWSSWNTYGFQINDSLVRTQADAMVNLGFFDKGYKYINIDDGFFGGRDKEGKLLIHPTRFPNGLRPLVDYIHAKGLKAGIYSDAGRNTCASFWGNPKATIGYIDAGWAADIDCMSLELIEPTQIETHSLTPIDVKMRGHKLHIQAPESTTVTIVDMASKQIWRGEVAGSKTIELPTGTYLVGDKKVVVK